MKFSEIFKRQEKNRSKFTPFLKALFLCTILAFLASVTMGAWYSYFEKTPLLYSNLPFRVINKRIKPGDTINLEITRCLDNSNSLNYYKVTQILTSLNGDPPILLGTTNIPILKQLNSCATSISVANILPKDLKPGKYLLTGEAEISGLFKKHTIDWYSEEFTVE